MTTERERARLERATQARAGTGLDLDAETVAALQFVTENDDGTTEWRLPPHPDADDFGHVTSFVLGPADLMRYALIDRMRDALQDGPRFGAAAVAVDAPPIDPPTPAARLADPKLLEGRTDDGWRWHLVFDVGRDEWMAAVDNRPMLAAHDPATGAFPTLYVAVIPVDVLDVIVLGARG